MRSSRTLCALASLAGCSTTNAVPAGGRQVPFAFEIPYDPAKIDPRMGYAVPARIEDGGQLQFINDQSNPVITRGAPARPSRLSARRGSDATPLSYPANIAPQGWP